MINTQLKHTNQQTDVFCLASVSFLLFTVRIAFEAICLALFIGGIIAVGVAL